MEFKNLLVGSIAKLEEFLELIIKTKPFKAIDYTKNVTPFDVLRTEKIVEVSDSLKELISKQDLTNELLAELVENSKTTPTKVKKVEKKK